MHNAGTPVCAADIQLWMASMTLTCCFDMMQVKPDDTWSISVHNAAVLEGRGEIGYHQTLACGAKVLHVFNMFRVRAQRPPNAGNDTVTYLWALQQPADA